MAGGISPSSRPVGPIRSAQNLLCLQMVPMAPISALPTQTRPSGGRLGLGVSRMSSVIGSARVGAQQSENDQAKKGQPLHPANW